MKKSYVIKNQAAGIKWYKHVESAVGVDTIIEKTINISKKFPDTWVVKGVTNRWSNVHWAFMNAFRDIYDDPSYGISKFKNNGTSAFNLDEVLSDEQIQHIKLSLEITEPYVDSWVRK